MRRGNEDSQSFLAGSGQHLSAEDTGSTGIKIELNVEALKYLLKYHLLAAKFENIVKL